MSSEAVVASPTKQPLTPERVFRAAVDLADEGGMRAVTMRAVADRLGVEAMSLYYHVKNKEGVLDGMVDTIVGEVELEAGGLDVPATVDDWQAAVRTRILVARSVMLRHPWAPAVVEDRSSISPTIMRYFDRLLGLMRAGGFSWDLVHHAAHALGSRALGFSGELFEPDEDDPGGQDTDAAMLEAMAADLPHVGAMLAEIRHDDPESIIGWCDDEAEFVFGLDLVLDGLEQRRRAEADAATG